VVNINELRNPYSSDGGGDTLIRNEGYRNAIVAMKGYAFRNDKQEGAAESGKIINELSNPCK